MPFNRLSPVFLFLLTACSTQPIVYDSNQQPWQIHQQNLSSLACWQAQGKMAIKEGHEGGHFSFDWHQVNDAKLHYPFKLTLNAPLGQGLFALTGDNNGVHLEHPSGFVEYAATPEALLTQQTGYVLPISYLRSWLLGLPAKNSVENFSLNEKGQLQALKQAGWDIRIDQYEDSVQPARPKRLQLHRDKIGMKIYVKEWKNCENK